VASISKEQGKALAAGFLDSLGSEKDDFIPTETISEIEVLAGELVLAMQTNLENGHKIASGELSTSIAALSPKSEGKVLSVDIEMLFYGQFINSGVKGTKSGSSTAGYSFRNERVSKGFQAALEKWIKTAHITTRTVKKYKGYGGLEKKRKSISQSNPTTSAAYAIGVAIKRRGLKPTGFIDKAFNDTARIIQDRLGETLRVDLINYLQKL
jgi:hypothetical protein